MEIDCFVSNKRIVIICIFQLMKGRLKTSKLILFELERLARFKDEINNDLNFKVLDYLNPILSKEREQKCSLLLFFRGKNHFRKHLFTSN